MIQDNFIKDTWKNIEAEHNWKDFILPKRTDEQFNNEGEQQAKLIQDIIDFEFEAKKIKVLEFGCGVARILKHLKADELHGADASLKFLRNINNSDIKTHYSDGLTLIQDINYFDFIYSIMVFQHNDKKYHTPILKNLHECLNDNGKVFIQFPQKPNLYYKETQFVNLYEKQELQNLFQSTGYSKIDITEGNLVGYGENGNYKPNGYLEYFVLAHK
jgi:cyclopropane fatty-acyl-phospholipid synthase-like methyltransferase|tara:strand:+ start:1978 stop:2625 length:648 start_codon:yes stop_codon:yes gene_type:complete